MWNPCPGKTPDRQAPCPASAIVVGSGNLSARAQHDWRSRPGLGSRFWELAALAHALLDSGAAFLVAGNAHWGPPRPTWSEAVYASAVTCHGSPPAHLACVAACWTCDGVCLPAWDSPANPCPWCRGHPGPVCPSCNTVIHNRGSCRWNSGAHPSYVASGEVNIRLCPDCWRAWAWSLAAALRRHPPPTLGANLLQHMRNSAMHCNPGAGSGTNAAPSLSTRKVRRWLLQHLEGGDLATLSSFLQELRAWGPAVADDWLPIALTRAIRALSAEGRICSVGTPLSWLAPMQSQKRKGLASCTLYALFLIAPVVLLPVCFSSSLQPPPTSSPFPTVFGPKLWVWASCARSLLASP